MVFQSILHQVKSEIMSRVQSMEMTERKEKKQYHHSLQALTHIRQRASVGPASKYLLKW